MALEPPRPYVAALLRFQELTRAEKVLAFKLTVVHAVWRTGQPPPAAELDLPEPWPPTSPSGPSGPSPASSGMPVFLPPSSSGMPQFQQRQPEKEPKPPTLQELQEWNEVMEDEVRAMEQDILDVLETKCTQAQQELYAQLMDVYAPHLGVSEHVENL